MSLVFSCSLNDLGGKCLDISPFAGPKQFRFFSAHAIHYHSRLEIYACDALPERRSLSLRDYGCRSEQAQLSQPMCAAVSYPWKGVEDDEDIKSHYSVYYQSTFSVRYAEDGDPISIQVLKDISWAAMNLRVWNLDRPEQYYSAGVRLVWLDRMSILQGDEDDKAWQISHMFEIYRRSTAIILPGGVQRLVTIDEETYWMDRAWTLQEAIAPLFP